MGSLPDHDDRRSIVASACLAPSISCGTIYKSSVLPLTTLGRWEKTPSGGLYAAWAGATIRFRCNARGVEFLPGPKTRRFDLRGVLRGVKTIVVHVRTLDGELIQSSECDVKADQYVALFESEEQRDVEVEMRLVDWQFTLEVSQFVVTDGEIMATSRPFTPTRLLFIGDSITSSYVDFASRGKFPRGVEDAYPFVLARRLETAVDVVEVVAFPGITMADYDHVNPYGAKGMVGRFWHASPRSATTEWEYGENGPTLAFIALGVNDYPKSDDGAGPNTRVTDAVEHLLTEMRRRISTLKHVVVLSPWPYVRAPLPDGLHEPGVRETVSSLRERWRGSGEPAPALYHVDTVGWYAKEDVLDGVHPSMSGHAKIAGQLLEWCHSNYIFPVREI